LFHLTSGTPSGGRTTLMTSLIRRYFMIRSAAVVELSDGEALT
jgi:predicted ATPase